VTGIIFDIKRYAIHDGPGIRTTLFLKGCPLNCRWCHNPEGIGKDPQVVYRKAKCIGCRACIEACPEHALSLKPDGIVTDVRRCKNCGACVEACPSGAREQVGKIETVQSVLDIIKKDVPFYDSSGGGVTFSGGEPLMQVEFLLDLLKKCGREEIHRAVDTAGFADTETLMRVARHTDLFLFDLKFMNPEKHRLYTGVSNEQILKNLESLALHGSEIIVRIPLIPGINDDDDNIESTGTFLHHLPQIKTVHILPYHDFQKSKYEKFEINYSAETVMPSSPDRVQEIKARLAGNGLKVEIGG